MVARFQLSFKRLHYTNWVRSANTALDRRVEANWVRSTFPNWLRFARLVEHGFSPFRIGIVGASWLVTALIFAPIVQLDGMNPDLGYGVSC